MEVGEYEGDGVKEGDGWSGHTEGLAAHGVLFAIIITLYNRFSGLNTPSIRHRLSKSIMH
jgi:hypothetical protein